MWRNLSLTRPPIMQRSSVKERVLITGGGGFVGLKLSQELIRRGYSVTALDIKFLGDKSLECEEDDKITRVEGDISDTARVYEVVSTNKPHGIFHVASYGMSGREMLNKALIEAVNVKGTQNVLNACRQYNVQWLVYTSTYNVVFGGEPIVNGDTSIPYLPLDKYVDHYSCTKSMAEQMVISANGNVTNDGSKLRTCSLRCAGIYGEGETRHLPRIVSYIQRGLFCFKYGDSNCLVEFIHVDNVVLAHCLAAERLSVTNGNIINPVAGQCYFISDGQPVNNFEFFRPLIEGLGYTFPKIRLPFGLIYFIAFLTEWIHSLVYLVTMGYSFQPLLTRAEVNKTGVTHYFSMDKAEQHLGYKPLKRNMDGVVKWYKKRLPQQQKKSTDKWMMIVNILLMFMFLLVLFSFIPLAS